jgi:hypothetical protein
LKIGDGCSANECLSLIKGNKFSYSPLLFTKENRYLKRKVITGFPLEGESEPWKGASFFCVEKAVNAGLSFRPLEETINDVYQWEKTRQNSERTKGISREREQELLETWFQKETKETL